MTSAQKANAETGRHAGCLLSIYICLGALYLGAPNANADDPRIPDLPSLYDRDPSLPIADAPPYIPPEWKQLWRESLHSSEMDLRREAAVEVLREHRRGNPTMPEMAPDLLEAFRDSESDDVRLATAAALIAVDEQDAAQPLAEFAATGPISAAQLIEPALARWNFAPFHEIWLQRLQRPDQVARQRLLLAIDGIRQTHLTEANAQLKALALDRHTVPGIRISAAEALGQLQSDGLLDSSIRLSSDGSASSLTDRLIAVKLLSTHEGPATEQQLLTLVGNDEPLVKSLALQRLLEIDPQAVHPLTAELLMHPEGGVRRLAAESLVIHPTGETVETLIPLLSDPHPTVRTFVRQSLQELAEDETLDGPIRQQTLNVLKADDWRGQEQSARLLAALDEEQAAERLIELLRSERVEVRVTAAWSLRELAVDRTLPQVYEYLQAATKNFVTRTSPEVPLTSNPGDDELFSYLFEWIGKSRYSEAMPLLVTFVPRSPTPRPLSRTAAVWALGCLYEHKPDEDTRKMLSGRITDNGVIPYSEHDSVRGCAAVGLGRMGDELALPLLRSSVEATRPGTWLQESSRWAIEQITGELPEPHGTPYPGKYPPNPFLRSLAD